MLDVTLEHIPESHSFKNPFRGKKKREIGLNDDSVQ